MEHFDTIVKKMYNVLLHRDPDENGLNAYVSKLNSKVPLFKLIQAICSSEEFIMCQLKLIKSQCPSVRELQTHVLDLEFDVTNLSSKLTNTNELFTQNCQLIEILQNENQILKGQIKNNPSAMTNNQLRVEISTQTDHAEVSYTMPLRSRNKLIKKSYQKVNVFLCVRNNENSLLHTLNSLIAIQEKFNLIFHYYIYENDSNDTTPFIIIDFYRKYNIQGSFKIEKISKREWTDVKDNNRTKDMAIYRNNMKSLCTDWSSSEYSLILDTDVEFSHQNFHDMIKLLQSSQDIAMVTPYAYAGNTLTYYDTYALDSEINICVLMPELQVVNSAFGGFVVLRTNILEKCTWGVTPDKVCSEHNAFCAMVQKHGKIVIARDIRVHWQNKFA
tara:strand:+ start:5355 stop:6515 length:1161 start_codon:yes stop_codon:yes gene_type:complete